MIIHTDEEKGILIEAGRRLAAVLGALRKAAVAGVTTEGLNQMAEMMINEYGDTPAFLNYTPEGAKRPYPATLCISINDEVVHGIPNESSRTLQNGDLVSLDLGLTHKGIIVDAAITVAVGEVDEKAKQLIAATEKALAAGIEKAVIGNRIGDISHAIQKSIENDGFAVVKELGGHGVGNRVHEDPFVANAGRPGTGTELVEGMMLALEPIATEGGASIRLAPDGYTYRTRDGSRAAHSEHTILIEKDSPRIITL